MEEKRNCFCGAWEPNMSFIASLIELYARGYRVTGAELMDQILGTFNFCPFCGRDMRKEGGHKEE